MAIFTALDGVMYIGHNPLTVTIGLARPIIYLLRSSSLRFLRSGVWQVRRAVSLKERNYCDKRNGSDIRVELINLTFTDPTTWPDSTRPELTDVKVEKIQNLVTAAFKSVLGFYEKLDDLTS